VRDGNCEGGGGCDGESFFFSVFWGGGVMSRITVIFCARFGSLVCMFLGLRIYDFLSCQTTVLSLFASVVCHVPWLFSIICLEEQLFELYECFEQQCKSP